MGKGAFKPSFPLGLLAFTDDNLSEEAIAQQRVKLEAQEQLVRLREDFASTLTHDLKTPLLGA